MGGFRRYQKMKKPILIILAILGVLLVFGVFSYLTEEERYYAKEGKDGVYIAETITKSIMVKPQITEFTEIDGFLIGHTDPTKDKSLPKEEIAYLNEMYPTGYFIISEDTSVFSTGLTKEEFIEAKKSLKIDN